MIVMVYAEHTLLKGRRCWDEDVNPDDVVRFDDTPDELLKTARAYEVQAALPGRYSIYRARVAETLRAAAESER